MFYPDNSERTIIKADPDWFVGWPYREDGKRGVALEPIVAWLIVHGANDYHLSAKASRSEKSVHANPYPITANGVQGCNSEEYCLKSPDGSFSNYNQTWETEAELLAGWAFPPQDAAREPSPAYTPPSAYTPPAA
jgi:hypothetical protein